MARAAKACLTVAFGGACHACGLAWEADAMPGRSARCASCGADLRCCLACRFHDASAWNECREPSAERVLEKDRANFCDYFAPAAPARGGAAPASSGLDELEKLFRK